MPVRKTMSDEEKGAMKARMREIKAGDANSEEEVLAKIAELNEAERTMAQRIHEIIKANAPQLEPKLWYGMPAYALKGKNVCFFQTAAKFKTRYSTFGFNDPAHLDDGNMWSVAYALTQLTPEVEAQIAELVKKAVR